MDTQAKIISANHVPITIYRVILTVKCSTLVWGHSVHSDFRNFASRKPVVVKRNGLISASEESLMQSIYQTYYQTYYYLFIRLII